MNLNGKATNPGELRTRIILVRRAVSTETGGFQRPLWEPIAQVWAKWINIHGAETWTAQSVGAEAPATVTIRHRNGLDATCAVVKGGSLVDVLDEGGEVTGQVIQGGTVYEIVSLDDIQERHEYLELKVKRMKAG
jgi:head-tail adaptor